MNTQVKILYSILYFVFISTRTPLSNAEPIVKVSEGLLNGTQYVSKGGRHFSAFIGIPFTEIPIGPLRFSNPVPKIAWHGIRSANKEANMCPQLSLTGNIIGDEDCLYLNVYSPVLNFSSSMVSNTFKGDLLPVMVWIHGGSFRGGSAGPSQFGPQYLLDKDIILVSMNYRLDILGFISTGDSVAPGNFGLKDQARAFKWIQQNIHIFGGDKNRVTIFGESAGAVCVNFHAISDASNGLFQQYIIQSGSVLAPWAYRKRSQFKPYVNQVAGKVGCSKNNSADVIKCLRETSVHKLLTSLTLETFGYPGLPWLPTDEPESKEAFLTDSPENLMKQNKIKNYFVMSGNVADEGITITLPFYINTATEPINIIIEKSVNTTANFYVPPEDVPKFREIVKDYYFNENIISRHPDKIAVVDKLAKISKNPVFYYMFNYRGSANYITLETKVKRNIGVVHGDELLYLFPILPSSDLTEDDKFVIDIMVDLWTSFATNGKPTSDLFADPNMWKPFSKNECVLTIENTFNNINRSDTLQQYNFTDRMDFWRKHFPILKNIF
ncbi:esterase FE4-like isoform X2 [Belonocnema kinseyi]|uniref:esterase FE4-like isoform X2 n=1 Tax=Belonocnema kinseyi TaxID=2817044 RepID=UPI00143CC64B|nr:esterase FE4-like isoform X2 [Belonocnema kinseyi]